MPQNIYQIYYSIILCINFIHFFPENLDLADDPKVITHPEVGKYFSQYKGNHYQPNKQKNWQYPQDMPVTLKFCRDKYGTGV